MSLAAEVVWRCLAESTYLAIVSHLYMQMNGIIGCLLAVYMSDGFLTSFVVFSVNSTFRNNVGEISSVNRAVREDFAI